MEHFPNVSAYCQRLKSLADQLKNVGAPVSDSRMVLQLVDGLTKPYRGVGMVIRQSNPLPPFYKARSMLVLEEAEMSKEAVTESAMVVTSNDDGPITSEKLGRSKGKQGVQHSGGRRNNGGRKNNNSGGGRRDSGSGKGGGKGQNSGGQGGSSDTIIDYSNLSLYSQTEDPPIYNVHTIMKANN
ncbi:uncharacterized protein LOC132618122 [Lycium barbarum]|uniref:uncharacterized protein LOC132618122 n=1 Tax=Lycium barbarum TaxID=112863 RepID=UPI00293F59A5|nr:uncharacterized protein LOC132618122 [Lycium barbarum]